MAVSLSYITPLEAETTEKAPHRIDRVQEAAPRRHTDPAGGVATVSTALGGGAQGVYLPGQRQAGLRAHGNRGAHGARAGGILPLPFFALPAS